MGSEASTGVCQGSTRILTREMLSTLVIIIVAVITGDAPRITLISSHVGSSRFGSTRFALQPLRLKPQGFGPPLVGPRAWLEGILGHPSSSRVCFRDWLETLRFDGFRGVDRGVPVFPARESCRQVRNRAAFASRRELDCLCVVAIEARPRCWRFDVDGDPKRRSFARRLPGRSRATSIPSSEASGTARGCKPSRQACSLRRNPQNTTLMRPFRSVASLPAPSNRNSFRRCSRRVPYGPRYRIQYQSMSGQAPSGAPLCLLPTAIMSREGPYIILARCVVGSTTERKRFQAVRADNTTADSAGEPKSQVSKIERDYASARMDVVSERGLPEAPGGAHSP